MQYQSGNTLWMLVSVLTLPISEQERDPSTLSNTDRPLSPTRPSKAKLRERLKAIKLCNK